ncbi:MAG TPA: HD domain-containing phosphohydrolase [Vicinamibacterales bacterium]
MSTENVSPARVLCVDDEPRVLEALGLHLRRRYTLLTATNGAEGLERLRNDGPIEVIVSDMRMPGMDGTTFLAKARDVSPDSVRILLTGNTDIKAAMAAVNQGQLFRFLLKPCPASEVATAVDAAIAQHRLLTAERVLLQETLHGSIAALTDVLAISNPIAFGRATRVRQYVSALAAKLEMPDRWQVEVAAMLSQIGIIALPPDTAEKVYYGRPLSEEEQAMVERTPAVADKVLGSIPRLEVVRGMIAAVHNGRPPQENNSAQCATIVNGARLIRLAADFDLLDAQGVSPAVALGTLRSRADRYGTENLRLFEEIRDLNSDRDEVREVPIWDLEVGMILVDEVRLLSGVTLAGRGYEVTESFAERGRNFKNSVADTSVRVIMPRR